MEFSHTSQFFSFFQEATAFDPPDYPREMNEEFNFRYDTKGLSGSASKGFERKIDCSMQCRFEFEKGKLR